MYPLFEFPTIGGGMIIALIATFHILPCHLATGGFWMAYFLERRGHADNNQELLDYIKKFALLILIFCFVLGSVTGAGIWFASTIISPRAISGLIHIYVWGWATEWVFFVIEVVAIYTYYYTFGKVSPKIHMRIGLIYAWSAWLSMVIITGILAFMMTPGKWLETGGFFDGFFNQTYWPQLFYRTMMMLAISGVFAAVMAGFMKSGKTKKYVIKTAGRWGLAGLVLGGLFAVWYYFSLPASAREILADISYAGMMFKISLVVGGIVALYFLLLLTGKEIFVQPVVAITMVIILFIGIGGGESTREFSRRPYLIPGYMYSNQVIAHDFAPKGVKSELERFQEEGFLQNNYFVPESWREVNADNYLQAGMLLTKVNCSICHTMEVDGRSSLPGLIVEMGSTSAEELATFLETIGDDYLFMPAFSGNALERRAAAAYMA
ncbi:MAG: cytochrome ubiquinol oxidase subunit I, partial [Deltaproteobacteria bacterium]|nr:cytochrome ubiquinol oxidase subunit I [Candidatus Tharpella sp.]